MEQSVLPFSWVVRVEMDLVVVWDLVRTVVSILAIPLVRTV